MLLVGTQGFVLYASGSSRREKKIKILGNGEMSWYIGAEGWHGTYTLEDGVVHAQLTSDLEQATQLWDFRVVTENETAELEMDYQDMTIYWVYGEQEESAAGTGSA